MPLARSLIGGADEPLQLGQLLVLAQGRGLEFLIDPFLRRRLVGTGRLPRNTRRPPTIAKRSTCFLHGSLRSNPESATSLIHHRITHHEPDLHRAIAPHSLIEKSVMPVHARLIYAASSSPMNRRSPRVVDQRQQALARHRRRAHLPDRHPRPASMRCRRRRSQPAESTPSTTASPSHPPHREALRDAAANEVDDQRARHDRSAHPPPPAFPNPCPRPTPFESSSPAIGFASTEVSVRASSSSTHENMKQKNAVTPMPALISGRRIATKNRGKE